MKFLGRLFNKIAIPNLTLALTIGSAFCFIYASFNLEVLSRIAFVPSLVTQGEYWRVFTFLLYPFSMDKIFAFFAYYLFYFMGTALEAEWGEAKFTHYIFIATISTIAAAFFHPNDLATNEYIFSSVFLAFAFLYPDFQFYLFFVIPVKVKYLAAITWIFFGWTIVTEPLATKILATIPLINFFLFFGKDIYHQVRYGKNQVRQAIKKIKEESVPFHQCATCGVTEKINPDAEFRVCLVCKGTPDYCQAHLGTHTHIPMGN